MKGINLNSNSTGLDFLKKVKDVNSTLGDDGYESAKFGYSGSDIAKMMEMCARQSGGRILREDATFEKVIARGKVYYKYSSIQRKTEDDDDTYVQLTDVKAEDRATIVNFYVNKDDIISSIANYPPTVASEDYMNILRYKYRGVVP